MADMMLILLLEEGDVLPDGTVLTSGDTVGWYAVGATDGHKYTKHKDADGAVVWGDRGLEG